MVFAAVDQSLLPDLHFWLALVQFAVSLGVITALGIACRYVWNRHRWRLFKKSIHNWFRLAATSNVDHPKTMQDDDWKYLVEMKLTDSNFSPFEIQQMIELAVVTAKGIIASQLV